MYFCTFSIHFPGGRREIHPDRIGISKHSADSSSEDQIKVILAPIGAGRGPTTTAIQLSNSNQFDSINRPPVLDNYKSYDLPDKNTEQVAEGGEGCLGERGEGMSNFIV